MTAQNCFCLGMRGLKSKANCLTFYFYRGIFMIVFKIRCKKCGYWLNTEFSDVAKIALNLHFADTGHTISMGANEMKNIEVK